MAVAMAVDVVVVAVVVVATGLCGPSTPLGPPAVARVCDEVPNVPTAVGEAVGAAIPACSPTRAL